MPVHVRYYTDPACPGSWALEPLLRRIEVSFGDQVSLTYVMGGLHREAPGALAIVRRWLEAGATSGMPVDPRLWLEGPPRGSYPACIAVVAAFEQGPEAGARYLRRVREGFACRRRKLDLGDALTEEARTVAGVDGDRFTIDISSNATLEGFGEQLEERRRFPDAELPFFTIDDQVVAPHELLDRLGEGTPAPLSLDAALRRPGTLAAAEVTVLCDLPGPRANAALWQAATEWRATPERLGSGELWSAA